MDIEKIINDAERIKKRGAGVSEFEKAYNSMLKALKYLIKEGDENGKKH